MKYELFVGQSQPGVDALHSHMPIKYGCLCLGDLLFQTLTFRQQTIRKSPDTPDKSGEICFGLVKYFNFFLINMFKFLQKYKNVW